MHLLRETAQRHKCGWLDGVTMANVLFHRLAARRFIQVGLFFFFKISQLIMQRIEPMFLMDFRHDSDTEPVLNRYIKI